jgi:hypothetical protein
MCLIYIRILGILYYAENGCAYNIHTVKHVNALLPFHIFLHNYFYVKSFFDYSE